MSRISDKGLRVSKQTRQRVLFQCRGKLKDYFERDDNSRAQPGKADVKRLEGGDKVQTRVLTDYLGNLHTKFCSENPEIKISLATFCRARPKHVLQASFISRHSCLCTKHQNMALKIKALRSHGMNVPQNPETFVKDDCDKQSFNLPDNVVFRLWKRVEIDDKGKKKQVMRVVEQTLSKENFLSTLVKESEAFREHIKRIRAQYEAIHTLKESLPPHQMVLQMDFSENYGCKCQEKVQSAYFNQTSVTLHPMVIYYRDSDNKLAHKSLAVISDTMSHAAPTVLAFLDQAID